MLSLAYETRAGRHTPRGGKYKGPGFFLNRSLNYTTNLATVSSLGEGKDFRTHRDFGIIRDDFKHILGKSIAPRIYKYLVGPDSHVGFSAT